MVLSGVRPLLLVAWSFVLVGGCSWPLPDLVQGADHGTEEAPVGQPDGGGETLPDAAAPDADATALDGSSLPACASGAVDRHSVALYPFEVLAATSPNVLAGHQAEVGGSGAALVAGPPGCGKAVAFPAAARAGAYLEVGDSEAWDLTEGSLEFWVRFDQAPGSTQGVLGRDASGNARGHFSVFRGCDGALVVRLQRQTAEFSRCSDPLSEGRWHRIGINFGPSTGLQLFVDRQQVDRKSSVLFAYAPEVGCNSTVVCGQNTFEGIDGNDNPWVIGAWSSASGEGRADPLMFHLGGAIDQLHIRSAPLDYGGPQP